MTVKLKTQICTLRCYILYQSSSRQIDPVVQLASNNLIGTIVVEYPMRMSTSTLTRVVNREMEVSRSKTRPHSITAAFL